MAHMGASFTMNKPPPQRLSYREAFLNYLKQVQRCNWEDKIFYLPSDVRSWMVAKSPGETYSNLVGLVCAVHNGDGFPKVSADQCTKLLLVFAALLHPDVNCEHLISVFARCNLSDEYLSLPNLTIFYSSIREDLKTERPRLPSKYAQYDYDAVIRAFDKVRWAFCPATLHLHMNVSFPSGLCILPFFYGEVINGKGVTANVHHYKIQEDLVESEELKKALAASKHYDETFGWCYEFAVKSYTKGWADIYKLESEAFRGVRDHKGVVKYLGEYHFREEGDTSPNHNIILEFGQQDLDDYLADTYPPVSNTEIISFWKDMFNVADTIKQLHQLKYKGEDGTTLSFKGWHGDIKPDNILRVNGKFKLADFGFAKFEKDEIGKSSTFMLGGTRTYGAPECDDKRLGTRTPHLQTIDTWSFGCVLSAVATWVILGSQAYDNSRQVRMLEIAELCKSGSAPSGDDAFHDGTKVLPSVLHWHDYLRNSSRKADTISCRVLDLIEGKMLLEDPSARLSFERLCDELDEIVLLAQNEYQKLKERGYLKNIAPNTLQAWLHLDEHAPLTATPTAQANTAQKTGQHSGFLLPSDRSQLRSGSERVRKSECLDQLVIGKTANREKAIKTDLGLDILNEAQEICDSPEQSPKNADESVFEPFFLPNNGQKTPGSSDIIHHESMKIEEVGGQNGDVAQEEEISNINRGHYLHRPVTSSQEHKVLGTHKANKYSVHLTQEHDQLSDVAPNTLPPTPTMSVEVFPANYPLTHNNTSIQTLFAIPDIFEERSRLEKLWGNKKSTFASLVGKIPTDSLLKNFISNRDIVFVVDNARSMKRDWATVTDVLTTLAMKVGPLDKDGLDLVYTIGQDHNLEDIKGWGIPKSFQSSMEKAGSEITPRHKTNMKETLEKIFDNYVDTKKKMTLIVLTDGLWEGCTKDDNVEKLIASFITKLKSKLKSWESRWFGIQFVSFGEDAKALGRLQNLDDNMPIDEDVIDTKPWYYPDVSKLILGSMTDGDDKDDAPSPSSSRFSSALSISASSTSTQARAPVAKKSESKRFGFLKT